MNTPSQHLAPTVRPEDSQQPDVQEGGSAAGTLPQHPREKPAGPEVAAVPAGGKKDIPDLQPGQAPPESSAGS